MLILYHSNFVVINQKGIDPPSLDILARAGVSCPCHSRSVTEIVIDMLYLI